MWFYNWLTLQPWPLTGCFKSERRTEQRSRGADEIEKGSHVLRNC